ncbi:hypothetical protein EON65_19365, partial [archaeon]
MERDSDSGSSSEDDRVDEARPKKEKNEQFLLSELLNQSYFRAKSLSDQIDEDAQARMRDIQSELSEQDYKKVIEAKEKRRSTVLQNQNSRNSVLNSPAPGSRKTSSVSSVLDSPSTSRKLGSVPGAGLNDGAAAETLASILAGINLTEDFKQLDQLVNEEVKREPGVMSLDDLNVHYEVFQNIITRSTKKHSERKERLQQSLKSFQVTLKQHVEQVVHEYKTSKNFYKFEHRIQELEHTIVRYKATLAEKRYQLKLQNSDRMSVDELRMKFEKETEELIRNLIQNINNITNNVANLQKKNDRVIEETDLIMKQMGEVLHTLEKEEKLAKQALLAKQQQIIGTGHAPDEEEVEDLYEVFPFLVDAAELTEEHVWNAQNIFNSDSTAQTHENMSLNQLKDDISGLQDKLEEMQKSEEVRALERLKRMIANTQDKLKEDEERFKLLEKLIQDMQQDDLQSQQ